MNSRKEELCLSSSRLMASDALTLASHFLYGANCSTCDRFQGGIGQRQQRSERVNMNELLTCAKMISPNPSGTRCLSV